MLDAELETHPIGGRKNVRDFITSGDPRPWSGENLAGRGHKVQYDEAWSNEMSRVCAITVDQETGGADPPGPAYAIGW